MKQKVCPAEVTPREELTRRIKNVVFIETWQNSQKLYSITNSNIKLDGVKNYFFIKQVLQVFYVSYEERHVCIILNDAICVL